MWKKFLLAPVLVLMAVWAALAIRFSNLPWEGLRIAAAAAFALGTLLVFVCARGRRALLLFAAAWSLVLGWWLAIPAKTQRDWKPELARQATASIDGDRATIRDLRDFAWRTPTEFEEHWRERSYDLTKLKGVDFVLGRWGGQMEIAHSMLSFAFADGEHVVVSIETRLERGEPQTGLRGLFKQYELIYVLGTEADVLGVRTGPRGEDVYVYPTSMPPERARALFVDVLRTATELAAKPRFYDTLTDNCTSSWLPHLEKVGRERKFDVRLLLNGHSDELAWERGTIENDVPLEELRRRHHVNPYVQGAIDPAEYSRRIRPDAEPGDR
jgi:hypothetical protein